MRWGGLGGRGFGPGELEGDGAGAGKRVRGVKAVEAAPRKGRAHEAAFA